MKVFTRYNGVEDDALDFHLLALFVLLRIIDRVFACLTYLPITIFIFEDPEALPVPTILTSSMLGVE